MSNISVTTTQSVIAVTQTGGITVTTPEGQTIAVTVPNSSVNVTNTTDDITITEVGITNTDQLIEGTTNLFFTNARARTAISLSTDDSSILDYNSTTGVFTWDTPTTTKIAEGTNLYYTTARQNTDFDTRLATKTTTNLAEGTNLYYTTARANTDFDTRLATKTTTNLAEGTNQYFTTARARQSLSAGTGISYDNATGVITNTSINTDTTYTIDASTATGGANLNLVGSDSSTDTVKIASGTNINVSRTDANTITIDGTDLNTTYTISSGSTTGGANLTLTGSDSSTDSVAYKGSGATTVTSTDANTITIASTDTNTTYTQNASSTTGGANLNLVGSDSTTDSVKFAGSGATTITRTDADTITVSSTDTNTTYSQNFSSTTGGTNLNLVGSDSTTDTVKFANGTGVTITRTDADTATIAIGQDVGTGANPTFAGGTFGAVTVGVDTDQTISTSSGNLILQTATGTNAGTMTFTAGTNGAITLAPNGSGSVAVNASSGITTNQTTFPIVNTTATTINMGGAATSNNIGAKTGGSSIISGTNRYTSPIAYNIGIAGAIPHRGLMISNGNAASNAVARTASVLRVFPTGAVGPRGGIFVEAARGNETTPTALQTNDLFGEFVGSGYATNSWVNDLIALPAQTYFYAAENWVNTGGPAPTAGTVTNCGNGYIVSLQPTATTLTSNGASRISVLDVNPQTFNTRSDAYNFKSKANTNLVTIASDGQLQVFNTNATSANNLYGYATKVFVTTTENSLGNNLTLKPGKLTGATGYDRQTEISVVQNTTDGTSRASFEVKTQRFDGTNYAPTVNNDSIGRFIFNGNTATGTTPATSSAGGASLVTYATETWSGSVSGTKLALNITKTGTNTGLEVASLASTATTFQSDAYTFKTSAGVNVTGNNINYNRVYGAFQYNTTVTPVAADTAYVFPIGTADFNNIVTVGSTSRIIIGAAGIYNLQFSVQVENTANAEHVAYIWLRKNGVDVTASMGRITLLKSASTIAGWNYYIDSANTTDYYEIAYAVNDTAVIFPTYAATAFGPSTASLITTISPVGA
jgi:hypothetical protein